MLKMMKTTTKSNEIITSVYISEIQSFQTQSHKRGSVKGSNTVLPAFKIILLDIFLLENASGSKSKIKKEVCALIIVNDKLTSII